MIRKSMSNFDAINKDGQIVMQFENTETQYILSNLTKGSSFHYEKSSINKVKYHKNVIVLYFQGGKTEILPNNDDIRRVGKFDSLPIKQ